MRKCLAVLLLPLALGASVFAQTAVTPESRLALGMTAYRAGDYASAVTDLQAAAEAFQAPDAGRADRARSFETALVYLALAQMRLNREDAARETLLRLHAAERIAPAYATLSLGSDAAEIEALAAALTPSHPLPRKGQPVRDASARREELLSLREAETAIGNARIDEAVRIYSGLAASPAVSREALAEAAVGLYRTGAFREAAQAFPRLGAFAKGEEDLRYYYAVALYESGSYAEAQKELACALPFIQVTSDVLRYRTKIESSVAQMARN